MPISFTGTYPVHNRVETGCLSLDFAVAGQDFDRNNILGFPLRCGYHVYSKFTGIGKTAFSLSLMGAVAHAYKKGLAIAPIDTFDLGNLASILEYAGMDGQVDILLEPDSHSKTLQNLNKSYKRKDIIGGMLDSAYSCMSTAVDEGEPEDSSVGRDAKMISTFVRQIYDTTMTSKEDKFFIVTNMLFPDLQASGKRGFGAQAMVTARGQTLRGLTSLHIKLTQQYRKNKAVTSDLGRLIHGKVEKNNFGPTNREFDVYMIGGIGIHRGLTAMYDCLAYGLVEEVKGAKISKDGVLLGNTREFHENWNDSEIFEPFFSAIDDYKTDIVSGKLKKVKEIIEDDDEQSAEELYEG